MLGILRLIALQGMRIRRSYRTVLERQIGKAITISRENRAGTTQLNSKGKSNRCTIHKIDTRSEKRLHTPNLVNESGGENRK